MQDTKIYILTLISQYSINNANQCYISSYNNVLHVVPKHNILQNIYMKSACVLSTYSLPRLCCQRDLYPQDGARPWSLVSSNIRQKSQHHQKEYPNLSIEPQYYWKSPLVINIAEMLSKQEHFSNLRQYQNLCQIIRYAIHDTH